MDHNKLLNRFREVVEQSPSIYAITDEFGKIEYINHRFTQILGYTKEDVIDKIYVITTKDEHGRANQKIVEEALIAKGRYSGELELEKKDGKNIWVRASIAPVLKKNKIDFYVCVFDDISLELELKRQHHENQEMMKTIMDNVTVSISLNDWNGNFTFFNKQAEKNLRLPAETLRNKSIVEIFPKEGPATLETIRQVFLDKKPVFYELSYNIKGKEYFFEINRLPLFNHEGNVYNVMTISRDITGMKYADKLSRIQRAIDSLQSIGETFEGSLNILFDNLFQLEWVDAGGLYLVDQEKDSLELIYHRGLSPEFIKNASAYPIDSLNARVAFDKMPRYTRMGEFLPTSKIIINNENLSFVASLPLIHQDKVLGLLNLASKKVVYIDQTDRQAIETIALKIANLIELIKTRMELDSSSNKLTAKLQELNIKQQMLIQKSRLESLGELSAGLAHEINQPLSIISLAMQNINYKLAQNSANEEYLNRKFFTITHNINKIRELIDHVRIFSRDQGAIMFERVDVNQVIINALSMINSQLRNHHISLKTELSQELGYTIGNPSRMEQVVLNLLSNARDALEEKEMKSGNEKNKMEIRIKTTVENNNIIIRVWDNGAGIEPDNLARIFNPFFTTKSAGHGTGLGLPIVYGIIREMKGDIMARSEPGAYTEISITLPHYKKIVEKN